MNIGVLGIGLMGKPLAERLLQANYSVIVYNRTVTKAQELEALGAKIAQTPLEAVQGSDILVLMLTDATAIREVLFGTETADKLQNRTIIQMGTIAPDESRSIQEDVEKQGGQYLEAPVLGSIPQAKEGTLLVMVGSKLSQFEEYKTILQQFGSKPQHIGEVGTASALKLALNQLIASLTSGFALSLGLIERQGVDVDKFMDILRESALYAPTFDKKLNRMQQRNFDNPNFPSKHLLKDVNLFLNQAEENGLNTEILQGIRSIMQQTMELGLSDSDYSALFSAINREKS
ncbi:NAD(P)-dependent oxidoreductase [Crocosphaera sp.]|uniref:NAD(P)-dependent oxidoreductase n=1 Tax=Crocosphaera sp. TaxID=2729996 RepID=UPI0026251E7A|nr:NAD(P)-dependent oxidoreductase [Crocosphaera sp.]MDJ0583306.1 NAD(P)-dependent oxidoreductase [Crocosphaera sp.]